MEYAIIYAALYSGSVVLLCDDWRRVADVLLGDLMFFCFISLGLLGFFIWPIERLRERRRDKRPIIVFRRKVAKP